MSQQVFFLIISCKHWQSLSSGRLICSRTNRGSNCSGTSSNSNYNSLKLHWYRYLNMVTAFSFRVRQATVQEIMADQPALVLLSVFHSDMDYSEMEGKTGTVVTFNLMSLLSSLPLQLSAQYCFILSLICTARFLKSQKELVKYCLITFLSYKELKVHTKKLPSYQTSSPSQKRNSLANPTVQIEWRHLHNGGYPVCSLQGEWIYADFSLKVH